MRAGIPGTGALRVARSVPKVLSGRFVWRDGVVWLEADTGDQWGPDWYSVVQGGWGSDEGVSKLPRPWRYSASGEILVEGDMVLIEFVNGQIESAVARPAPTRPTREEWLDTSFAEGGAERLRTQFTPRDPDTGAAQGGTYREEIASEDGRIVNTIEAGKIRAQSIDGSPERLVLGETYLAAENDAFLQASPVLVAAAGFFGLPFEDIVAFAGKLTTSDTEAGEPFLTSVLEAE